MMLQAILSAAIALGAPQSVAPSLAASVVQYAKTPTEAAFLLAWGWHESNYQARIIANECKRWECDRGRARGAWQLHERAAGDDWSALPGSIDAQARSAARMTRWALGRCKGDARCAFRVLGGLQPDARLKGEDERVASYERARRAL